jgi:glutamate dehydrogenase/leucine dehydrogenase
MGVFDAIVPAGYEQVVFGHDHATGLRAIVAIHDTTLGPSLGGVRMRPYATEDEALEDVLRLARAMTYKFAAAGIDLGGGKSVVIADPTTEKTEALLRAFGRLVATLGGRYIPGIDMGTNQDDMRTIGLEADPVSCTGVDPSPFTALGVYSTIRACLAHVDRSDDLDGARVAIQGAGHVGVAALPARGERGRRHR